MPSEPLSESWLRSNATNVGAFSPVEKARRSNVAVCERMAITPMLRDGPKKAAAQKMPLRHSGSTVKRRPGADKIDTSQ